jgi:N-acyl-D-amino-acid deacylase
MSPLPISDLLGTLDRQGTAVNFAGLTGHNSVRAIVMGRKTGIPTEREMRRMRALVEQDMQAGSFGLSSGLTYFPGRHSTMKELIELATVAGQYGGLYATHMRSEGSGITHALEEAIHIGEKAGLRVQVSHLKLFDEGVWGKVHLITDRLAYASQRGVEIFADQYPYTASSTSYTSMVPQPSRRVLRNRSKTSPDYLALKDRLARVFQDDLDRFYVATHPPNSAYEGKSFVEILTMQGRELTSVNASEALIDMLRRGPTTGLFFFMEDDDVESLMQLPRTMIGSDSGVIEFGEGNPHSRNYGTYPRVFARYVREKQILSVEEAVRKMTSLPAEVLRLHDRGHIAPGYWADLVVFDLDEIRDTATYAAPHQYPEGIAYVLVNGQVAAADGKLTGSLAGRVLYGPGRSR